jgi:hypothetical protein
MEIGIGYLPVHLKRRRGSTQNKVKTNPALITTQISIWDTILVSFELHFGDTIPSKTEFRAPLNEDNDSDIVVAV